MKNQALSPFAIQHPGRDATKLPELLLYCRAGFESECLQEMAAWHTAHGRTGYANTERGSAQVRFFGDDGTPPSWRELVFARQVTRVAAEFEGLDTRDRLTPILDWLADAGTIAADLRVDTADSDAGAGLAGLRRSLEAAALSQARARRLLRPEATHRLHLHLFGPTHIAAAFAPLHGGSPWPQGIPRLKFPRDAPSRSTLKLDEAFHVLLNDVERARWLRPGLSAIDLGAAPGGWTYQFVRRAIRVSAVDNGPIASALLESGLVTHLREDGFRFRPKKPVEWMVCDMVEQPLRVAELVARWLVEGHCQRTVFNLKLPMKKRYAEIETCLHRIREFTMAAGRTAELRAKQLYHDREEITVFGQLT